MADAEDVQILKGTTISVTVEEALIDVLVVVFRRGNHVFQGALLDVSKKNCPLGINTFQPWGDSPSFPIKDVSAYPGVQPIKDQLPEDDDRYHALKQRFTYYQQPPPPANGASFHMPTAACVPGGGASSKNGRRALGSGAAGRGVRDQSVRMRRLRPRQVLCSQCRSICNENSDNVQRLNEVKQNGRKLGEPNQSVAQNPIISSSSVKEAPSYQLAKKEIQGVERCRLTRGSHTLTTSTVVAEEYRLRPAGGAPGRMILRKRKPDDEDYESVPNPDSAKRFRGVGQSQSASNCVSPAPEESSPGSEPAASSPDTNQTHHSEEDEDNKGKLSDEETENAKSQRHPVIKISFANPQGHDTVVEIPARPKLSLSDVDASAKAAKKALKKAKKEAQRKASSLASSSPTSGGTLQHTQPGGVPHHQHQGSSPSPLSEATSNSPSMMMGMINSTSTQSGGNHPSNVVVALKRHKHHKHHKVKRKRRHRTCSDDSSSGGGGGAGIEDGNMQDENRLIEGRWGMVGNNNSGPFTVADIRPSDGLYEEVRNNCLRQKLSISLKRLSARAYARCSPRPHASPTGNPGLGSVSNLYGPLDTNNHHNYHYYQPADVSNSDTDSEDVPDFPRHEPLAALPAKECLASGNTSVSSSTSSSKQDASRPTKPLMMRITTHSVPRCSLDGGREMLVGDIVWGKIHGFPWWPGKVLALSVSQRDTGLTISQQAHVSWFGSSTSSLMPCQQLAPFLLDFKSRYNRKKRGPYKEAIRQATLEAQQLNRDRASESASNEFPESVGAANVLILASGPPTRTVTTSSTNPGPELGLVT